MSFDKLLQQLSFIQEIDKLKYIKRKTRLFNSDRHENDAEHSWHLALMAMVLAEHANEPVDVSKVVKMLLIHDIVEIDSGDVFLFDTLLNHDDATAEHKAALRIFGLLPEEQSKEFLTIWEEFEARETPESRFAHAIDRFEPVLQNVSNQGGSWKEFNVDYEKVIKKVGVIDKGSSHIWDFAKTMIDDSLEKGYIHKPELPQE
ncbi:phosphohydrolase [Siphonobacter sp. BAB-5405]|uniref:HD domain-containing protein n=1 Tax=Siphonobacter sp. BAB-5405 TaxID=1864825 RepID=UPI000C7F92A1|nr:HD domain-containing protein [Siphonobacter sp. BAB-5405]PMD90453.1 phosphohydrolase [Siphonobacter sp. BAB-5405]